MHDKRLHLHKRLVCQGKSNASNTWDSGQDSASKVPKTSRPAIVSHKYSCTQLSKKTTVACTLHSFNPYSQREIDTTRKPGA